MRKRGIVIVAMLTALTLFIAPPGARGDGGDAVPASVVSDRENVIGSAEKNGVEITIPAGTFDKETRVNVKAADASKYPLEEGVKLLADVYEIAEENAVHWLSREVTVKLRLPPGIDGKDCFHLVGGYYDGEKWVSIEPDFKALEKGYVQFDTPHFSPFASLQLSDTKAIMEFSKKTALCNVELAMETAAVAKELTQSFLETLDKMGFTDQAAQGILMQAIAKESDYGALIVAAKNGNLDDFSGQACQMIADAAIKCMDNKEFAQRFPIKAAGSLISGAAAGAEKIYDGDYSGAYKAFLYSAMDYYPAARAVKAVIAAAEAGNSMCIDYAFECGYEEYLKIKRKGEFDEAMWPQLFTNAMRAGLDRMKIEYRKSYAAANGMSVADIEKDEILRERLNAAVEESVKRRFRQRDENEQAVKAEERRTQKQIEQFLKFGLLEHNMLMSFPPHMTMTERLNSLYKIRRNIIGLAGNDLSVFGPNGALQDEALAYAIAQWLLFGKDRAAFCRWMQDSGYMKPPREFDSLYKLLSKAVGGELPPSVWEKNRFKYWRVFAPVLKDPAKMAELNTMSAADLKNWLKKYKDRRAKERGVAFGTPGADNPDDNENIGAALLALPAQERPLWLRALAQGDEFMAEWLKSCDREAWGNELSPETLGAFLDAALDSAPMELAAELSDEQREALGELCRDVAWNAALTPDVAILSSGYARGAAALLGGGEAAAMVRPDASPELLANYRLLIVPSGALSDYAASARFRGAIERYLEAGGTVLAFAQQLGREYAAVPGGVVAYGFAEDQSCQYASARIITNNGAFASMTKAAPDFNVDGYFLDWPEDGEVWLSRTKNDQPCMISYPWKNGRVVLSTLYMDWAAGNHQGTADEKLFCRDLVAFLLDGEDVPFVAKGSGVKIYAAADAPKDGAAVTPPENVDWQSFAPLVIAPDGTQLETKFESGGWLVPEASQSGFYRVGADFLDGEGQVVGRAAPKAAFAVSVLPEDAAAPPAGRLPFSLTLASDLENYIRGAQGRFTARFWERSGREQDLTVRWRFIHNGWAASVENKKLYAGTDQVRLPANGEFALEKTIAVINTDGVDRFYVDVFDAKSGAKLAAMSKGFYTHAPRAAVKVVLDKSACESGGALTVEMRCENPFKVPYGGTARFVVLDGAGQTVLTEEKSFSAGAESAAASCTLKMPGGMLSGPCSAQVSAVLKGIMVGAGSAPFNYLGTPQEFRGVLSDRITKKPISQGTVAFHLGEARFEATSGEDGGFALQIPAGKFALQARAAEYNDFDDEALLAPENQPLKVELLPAGSGTGVGTARGRVIDRVTGELLPGMELSVRRGDETYLLRSDAAGNWSAALLPGNYEVRCLIDAASPDANRFELRVEEGLELRQDLHAAVGKLRFKVFDAATGEPAENVQALVNTESGWTRDVSASLNRERAERLPPGRGKIRLAAAGYETLETEFFAGERVSDFTAYLRPTVCDVSFETLDWVTEKPVEGARVTVDGSDVSSGTADGRGLAVVRGAAVGRRRIAVEAPGYRKLETEGFFAAAAKEPAARRLYLTPDRDAAPGEARFVVRDLISDEPLEGVKIAWDKVETVTDAEGAASMPLPDGRRKLKFTHDGFAALETELLMNAVNAEAETYWLAPLTTRRTLVLRNHITGAPLKDVKVSLDGKLLGATGKDGTLAATTPVGRLKFAFEHKDFEPLRTELFFNACVQEASLSEEIFLKPKLGGYAYTALVRDPAGAPLKDAEVTLRAGGAEYKTKSDAKGLFAFRLPMGVFDLKLALSGYRVLETSGYSGGGSRKGVVEDYVLYPADQPLPEGKGVVCFEVIDAVSGEPIAPLRADVDGRLLVCGTGAFEHENRSGNRDVSFSAAGYEESGLYGTAFFPGQTVTRRVHLWPLRGEIEFKVCDAMIGEPLKRFAGRAMGGWRASFGDGRVVRSSPPGGERSNFWADGYAETGDFYLAAFPGRRVTRTVALCPSVGTVEFRVRDALSGEPLQKFVGRVLDRESVAFTGGVAATRATAENRRTNFWAGDYDETCDFYPAAFPGRTAVRVVSLWPRAGTVEFRVFDAVSGEPLERFVGYALDGGTRAFEGGVAGGRASAGNR